MWSLKLNLNDYAEQGMQRALLAPSVECVLKNGCASHCQRPRPPEQCCRMGQDVGYMSRFEFSSSHIFKVQGNR